MNKKNTNFKAFIPLLVISILIIVIVVASTSFGFFEYLKKSTTINKVTTGSLIIEVDDNTSLSVTSSNALPVSDSVGEKTTPYVFDLNNIGGVGANYQVKLIDDVDAINSDGCTNIQMPKSSLRYQIIRNNEVIGGSLLSNLTNNVIDSGYISGNTIYNYQLRVWIDKEAGAEIMGKHFHGKIEVVVSDKLND